MPNVVDNDLFRVRRETYPFDSCDYCDTDTPADYTIESKTWSEQYYYACYMHIEFAIDDLKSEVMDILNVYITTAINTLIDNEPERLKNGFEYTRRKLK